MGDPHWSGYVDTAGQYKEIISHFTQPGAYDRGCGGGPTEEATWVGLGGWNSSTGRIDARDYASGPGAAGERPAGRAA
jgi:hypothetical protein